MDYKLVTPNNFGILEAKLSQRHVDLLYAYIKDTAYEGYKFEGNEVISHSKDNQWSLIDRENIFEQEVLQPLINVYAENWGWPLNLKTTHYHNLEFNRFWVRITTNDQYQSIHDHQAVFSFVVWLKIPTDYREEQEGDLGFAHPDASDFVIQYTNTLGQIQQKNYKLDPSMEGTLILFPSDMGHMVYPSYTKPNSYRISVAGDVAMSSMDIGEKLV